MSIDISCLWLLEIIIGKDEKKVKVSMVLFVSDRNTSRDTPANNFISINMSKLAGVVAFYRFV